MRTRLWHLDGLRIAACFLVIVNHTGKLLITEKLALGPAWTVAACAYALCKMAVPLFILISGAVLLGKNDSWRKVGSRMVRILIALVVFSIGFYLLSHQESGGSVQDFLKCLWQDDICYAYWYLYMYLALLIMLPLLQKLAQAMSERDFWVLAAALLFVSLLPQIAILVPALQPASSLKNALPAVWPALFMVGYFCQHKLALSRRTFIACACIGLACIAINVAGAAALVSTDNVKLIQKLDSAPYATYLVPAICCFYCVRYLAQRKPVAERPAQPGLASKLVSRVSACTFGIYLIHVFFLWIYEPSFTAFGVATHPLLSTFLWQLAIFASALAVTALLRLIPGVRKVL